MNKLCIGILFATAIAWAGIGVVNFPYGEKSGGPDACRAIQLNVQGVSPASGTVSIGEITKRWETYATNYTIRIDSENFKTNVNAFLTVYHGRKTYDGGDGDNLIVSMDADVSSKDAGYDLYSAGESASAQSAPFDQGETDSHFSCVAVGQGGRVDGKQVTFTLLEIVNTTPHATTNALWTLTAAGGNATNNLPDKTFLRFAGHDFVRYGTATGGVVNLFVED